MVVTVYSTNPCFHSNGNVSVKEENFHPGHPVFPSPTTTTPFDQNHRPKQIDGKYMLRKCFFFFLCWRAESAGSLWVFRRICRSAENLLWPFDDGKHFFFFEEEGWGVHLKQLQMLAPLGNQNSFCVSPPKLSRWTAKIKKGILRSNFFPMPLIDSSRPIPRSVVYL